MDYCKVELPSNGKFYNKDIEICAMTGRDEEIMAGADPSNLDRVMKKLLENTTKGIEDIGKLTTGDRMFLLMWLSANSVSATYPTALRCDGCLAKFECEVELDSIEINAISDSYDNEVRLSDGNVAKLHMFTVNDEIVIADYEEKNEDAWLFRWACTVDKIVGKDDLKDAIGIASYLGTLPRADLGKIRKFQNDNVHGPDLSTGKYTCPHCSHKGEVTVPFRVELLFPYDG